MSKPPIVYTKVLYADDYVRIEEVADPKAKPTGLRYEKYALLAGGAVETLVAVCPDMNSTHPADHVSDPAIAKAWIKHARDMARRKEAK